MDKSFCWCLFVNAREAICFAWILFIKQHLNTDAVLKQLLLYVAVDTAISSLLDSEKSRLVTIASNSFSLLTNCCYCLVRPPPFVSWKVDSSFLWRFIVVIMNF